MQGRSRQPSWCLAPSANRATCGTVAKRQRAAGHPRGRRPAPRGSGRDEVAGQLAGQAASMASAASWAVDVAVDERRGLGPERGVGLGGHLVRCVEAGRVGGLQDLDEDLLERGPQRRVDAGGRREEAGDAAGEGRLSLLAGVGELGRGRGTASRPTPRGRRGTRRRCCRRSASGGPRWPGSRTRSPGPRRRRTRCLRGRRRRRSWPGGASCSRRRRAVCRCRGSRC